MASTPEGRVKAQIKTYLKSLKGCWFYMPVQNGMGMVGIPDIIGVWQGQFFGIECKAPGKENNVTPNQHKRLTDISHAGGIALVASSVDAVKDVFECL